MKLAIVGSTKLINDPRVHLAIETAIVLYRPTLIISGGARGVDTTAREEAEKFGIPMVEYLPEARSWSQGFKPRNMKIAASCDRLIRIAKKGATTYGSGWTRDYAKSLGKPTEEILLD